MLKQYSIAEARDRFTRLVRQVEMEPAIELTRRGKPVAVLMSFQEYQRLQTRKMGFWEAFTDFRSRVNLEQLDIQPETFANLRDPLPGREVAL